MTIYIAVCDDNIADRKQTERLLEREKDARLKENGDVLYIDSFGSSDALLKTPVKYDMFILDLTSSVIHGMDLAKSLRSKGLITPITLLSSKIDYKSFSNAPDEITILNKPISQGNISHIVDIAENWAANKPRLIEIRGKSETVFLPHTDLVRATQKSSYVEAALSNGTYIEIPGSLNNFQKELFPFKCFIGCKNVMINIHHIVKQHDNTISLTNNETYELPLLKTKELLYSFISYAIEQNTGERHAND